MSLYLDCIICNKSTKNGGFSFVVNNEYAVHCECIEEHCEATDCPKCKVETYPNCAFLSMKNAITNSNGG